MDERTKTQKKVCIRDKTRGRLTKDGEYPPLRRRREERKYQRGNIYDVSIQDIVDVGRRVDPVTVPRSRGIEKVFEGECSRSAFVWKKRNEMMTKCVLLYKCSDGCSSYLVSLEKHNTRREQLVICEIDCRCVDPVGCERKCLADSPQRDDDNNDHNHVIHCCLSL